MLTKCNANDQMKYNELVWHVARIEERRDSCRVVVEGNVRERVYLEGELDVDGRITKKKVDLK